MWQHTWKQTYRAVTFITVGEGWDMRAYTDTHGVYLPMHALEEVKGQCWASPSITLLCFILRQSLGEPRAHQLPRLVPARLGYLPVSTYPSSSGVTDINTQIFPSFSGRGVKDPNSGPHNCTPPVDPSSQPQHRTAHTTVTILSYCPRTYYATITIAI